jgi:ABC-type transport system substrate-binding protein
MRTTAILAGAALGLTAAETTLTITAGTQSGFFQTGTDVGSMNPHDYRPNEFVTNDFIYDGLVAWDGSDAAGVDGTTGTDDDYVAPSLATSWTTNYASSMSATDAYTITFTLREGVTFHDGSAWDADAAMANFNQIMGGDGSLGGAKAMRGMHDWLGFTQSLDGWSAPTSMTFKLTFSTYYEAALRELTYIRPFRMISKASLPDMVAMELSHNAWRGGAPRVFSGYTMRGVSNPIGTGPYQVVDKLLSTGTRIAAADFNASCYTNDACEYADGGTVSEILFTKVAGHWKNPTYDNVIFKSYDSISDVKAALTAGTLDVAYGVNVLSPSAFISLATSEEGVGVVAHKASHDLNTRLLVLNSGGRLNTKNLRKYVMGLLAGSRDELQAGELAEEKPMDTLFDPELPYCSVLSTLDSSVDLAATTTATASDITEKLRFMYIKDVPHQQVIAAEVIATLYAAGIEVEPMPVDKDTYNARHCDYLGNPDGGFPYWYSYPYAGEGSGLGDDTEWHSWDIAYSETWGPPYDATSKLWDMTHGLAGWCSAEADAPPSPTWRAWTTPTS